MAVKKNFARCEHYGGDGSNRGDFGSGWGGRRSMKSCDVNERVQQMPC